MSASASRHIPAGVTSQVRCSQCGKSNLRPRGTLAMRCDFCAAFSSVDPDRLRIPVRVAASASRTASRATHTPGMPAPFGVHSADRALADARLHEINGELYRQAVAHDDKNLAEEKPPASYRRWLIQEQAGLSALLYPQSVPRSYRSLPLEHWIEAGERAVQAADRLPAIAGLRSVLDATAARMAAPGSDAVAEARAAVVAAEAYYRALHKSSLFFGQLTRHPDADDLARDHVRMVLSQYTGQIGYQTARRVCTEVLGDLVDSARPPCPRCAALLSRAELDRGQCARCQKLFVVFDDQAWLEEQVIWWHRMAGAQRSDSDLAASAVQWILRLHVAAAETPPAAQVLAFLRLSVPFASRADVELAIRVARHLTSARPDALPVLDAIEKTLEGWQAEPGLRPVPPREKDREAVRREAFTRSVLARWQLASVAGKSDTNSAADLLIQLVIVTYHTDGEVPPEVAVELVRRAEPPLPRAAVRAAVERARTVYAQAQPAIGELLARMLVLLDSQG